MPLTAMVGVSVMGKVDMIDWILEGIARCFPPLSDVVFYFEACEDDSEKAFDALAPGRLQEHVWRKLGSSKTHLYEQGCHRLMIEHFKHSGADYLIIPHDDNSFQDTDIPAQIERVIRDVPNLGWIGCRDGYEFGYSDMVSSEFSTSDKSRLKLSNGSYLPRTMLNTGPVIYTRKVIEIVGLPDPRLKWYWWDDYSLRCRQAGLQNVLLGMDCLHTKFGRVQGMPPGLYDGATVAADLKVFRDRWRPILGRDPL